MLRQKVLIPTVLFLFFFIPHGSAESAPAKELLIENMINSKPAADPITFVPIGDSYTVGTGVDYGRAWPFVLADKLTVAEIPLTLVAMPARSGWDSQYAYHYELRVFKSIKPRFGTLLIGTNDIVKGIEEDVYQARLALIMEHMLHFLGDSSKLLVLTLPDFTVTPAGKKIEGKDLSKKIIRFNEIIAEEADKRGVPVFDLYKLSKDMADDPALIAEDGLHPSAKAHEQWADALVPVVKELLTK